MLAVAAQRSEDRKQDPLQLEEWVEKLSTKEQHGFLIRLSRGEPNLSVLLNRRLHELANKVQPSKKIVDSGQRTIAELIQAAEEWRDRKQKDKQRKAELARKRRLEELGGKENEIWQQVESLIEEKKPKSYDSALALLKDLRNTGESWKNLKSELQKFNRRIQTGRLYRIEYVMPI
ncbi:MAG: hypothetical protein L3J17_03455 [Candidatus Jettenia sp.]|nr:MAG: hypothetical protein L3J17_03455 [Candidatus Jettenia sp.]